MMIAGIPFAGVLALIVLLLGIAQVPALLVTLPVIGYIWASGDYATVPAVICSVFLFLAGMLDNVLKPLMLGRGVDAPMPVILLGALGRHGQQWHPWECSSGRTLLALGYQFFMGWVAANPDPLATPPERESGRCGLSKRGHHADEPADRAADDAAMPRSDAASSKARSPHDLERSEPAGAKATLDQYYAQSLAKKLCRCTTPLKPPPTISMSALFICHVVVAIRMSIV